MGSKGPKFLHAQSEDSGQTRLMLRLTLIFAEGKAKITGFVTPQFIFEKQTDETDNWGVNQNISL